MFESIKGHKQPKKILESFTKLPFSKVPQLIVIEGNSGLGKSHLAELYINGLSKNQHGLTFIKGWDIPTRETLGDAQIVLLDAVDALSKYEQSRLIELLEQTHRKFILTVSSVNNLIPQLKTRAITVSLVRLKDEEISELLHGELKSMAGHYNLPDAIMTPTVDRIVKLANGVPRIAFHILNSLTHNSDYIDSLDLVYDEIIRFLGHSLTKDHTQAIKSIETLSSHPLSVLKQNYELVLVTLARESSGIPTNDKGIASLYQLTRSKTMQVIRLLLEDIYVNCFKSDIQFQTAFLALYQLLSGKDGLK